MTSAENKRCTILHLFSFLATLQAKRACFVAFTAYFLCFACGIYVLTNYMTDIFAKTGSSLSPKTSSLTVAITTMIGNLLFFAIVEHFSRKVCDRNRFFSFPCESFKGIYFFIFPVALHWISSSHSPWIFRIRDLLLVVDKSA